MNKLLTRVVSMYLTIVIPLIYLYNIFLAYAYPHTMRLSIILILFGILLAIAGIFLWLLSFYYLGFSFGVLPQKQKRVRRGIYSILPHPMYVGIWMTFVGLSMANQSLVGLLFVTIIMTPLLFIRATLEDRNLHD